MPKIVVTHAVVDVERWLKGKAERAAAIESGSGSNVTDYVAQDGSNNIAITADVADVDAIRAMLAAASRDHGEDGGARRRPSVHGLHRGVATSR